MPQSRDERSGVSYRDVETTLREVQNEHCCNVRFELTTPVTSGTAVLFWVGCVAEPRIVGRKTIRKGAKVSRKWPHVDHQTMAGLMLWLLYELDKSLEAQGHVAAEQAEFAWA